MGKIKKILENELIGGTQTTDVYPVTSIKAVYDEDNERLDNIIKRKGVVNISTNYNADHTAEVLTLAQAIAKVPTSDRVIGFSGTFLSSDGWESYQFTGSSISEWTDQTKWKEPSKVLQELGDSTRFPVSQKVVRNEIYKNETRINETNLQIDSIIFTAIIKKENSIISKIYLHKDEKYEIWCNNSGNFTFLIFSENDDPNLNEIILNNNNKQLLVPSNSGYLKIYNSSGREIEVSINVKKINITDKINALNSVIGVKQIDITGEILNNSYINNNGSLVNYVEHISCTDFIEINPNDIILYTGGIGSDIFAVFFYNDHKELIDKQIRGQTLYQEIINIPEDAKYIRANGRNDMNSGYRVALKLEILTLNSIASKINYTIKKSNNFPAENIYKGYYANQTHISENPNYTTYVFTAEYSGDLYINSVGSSKSFFRVIAGKGTVNDYTIDNYANIDGSGTNATFFPTENNTWKVKAGDIILISVLANATDFKIGYNYNIKYLNDVTINGFDELVNKTNELEDVVQKTFQKSIKIVYENNKRFSVYVKQSNSDKIIKHVFIKQFNEDNLTYGDNSNITLVTSDVWYPSRIEIDSNNAIQGNLNFIYKISAKEGFENEGGHVGAGHGCEVAIFQKFFADGKEFNPNEDFGIIECEVFRILLRANNYAIDKSRPGFSSEHALPKLDNSGNPIITAIHTLDAKYRINNVIDWDNTLTIKRNNVKFEQLHAGMCQGQASHFNEVTISGAEYCTNHFEYAENNEVVITKLDRDESFLDNPNQIGSTVMMYGKNTFIRQKLIQEENRVGKNSYFLFVFYKGDNRLKVYMQPVKTTAQFNSEAEVFNSGDIIKCHLIREIETK